MFLVWKNEYCENNYTIQSNLYIQNNLYQIINGFFHIIEYKIVNMYGNTKDPD